VKEWATINRVELPNGVFYRVVVGPYATAQQAERLCSSLKAEGAPCFIRET
jgi:cell division protein FtsN